MRHFPKSKIRNPKSNAGLTLIELLVAMAITLVMVYALILMFEVVGRGVSEGRANIQMSEQLRHVSNRLHDQLDGLTIQPRPWPEPASGSGYLTILEGPGSDAEPLAGMGLSLHELEFQLGETDGTMEPRSAGDSIYGDVDDVIAFTARTTGEPFVGRLYDPSIGDFRVITSNLAEIVLFTRWDDRNRREDGIGIPDPGEVTLYQRILLIRPDLNTPQGIVQGTGGLLTPGDLEDFYQLNDLSVRPYRNNAGNVIGFAANSLADLTKRENRFAHYPIIYDNNSREFAPVNQQTGLIEGFPYQLDRAQLVPRGTILVPNFGAVGEFGGDRSAEDPSADDRGIRGDDVLLTNVLAFDVRVYDPLAPIRAADPQGLEAVEPGDPGFGQANPTPIGRGTFVDLNWSRTTASGLGFFSGPPSAPAAQQTIRFAPTLGTTYCTWSFHYEYGGPGTDGFDNTPPGQTGFGVDSVDERRTAPPYPVALRGLEIRLRIYDDSARQVRQTRVVANFVP